tara:strand:+ start:6526 stop:6675 length:150 start_codon:yes stop_codon:yes gene_type:complete
LYFRYRCFHNKAKELAIAGQANGPFGVGKKISQVQTGFIFSEFDLTDFT